MRWSSSRPKTRLTREEWDFLTRLLLFRSGHRCECCGQDITGVSRDYLEIQHRRARGMGGTSLEETNNMANLLIFHQRCHHWVESRPGNPAGPDGPDLAEQRGLWVRHAYRDGVPVPVEEVPLVLYPSGRQVFLDPRPLPLFYIDHPDPYGYTGVVTFPGVRPAVRTPGEGGR